MIEDCWTGEFRIAQSHLQALDSINLLPKNQPGWGEIKY